MGNKKSDYNVVRILTGGRRPGALRPDPPESRVYVYPWQAMGDPNELPVAQASGPSTMWFNNTGEFDRWYRRLHPMRHVVAQRLQRIERDQLREREIRAARESVRERRFLNYQLSERGRERGLHDTVVERAMEQMNDADPLLQFNRRARRRSEEAMERETNDLAQRMERLRIF